ncbi:AfsR/SARP family transcriptional regulator [Actinoplanes sp. CA-015351]|uniref:AfsR/SARP family transcriptional regulator n=1 Tax=Actinoplanes sp. CA-015351 TaxID=3239897 RepID=UPI003D9900C7
MTGMSLELLDGFRLRAGADVVEVSDIGQRLIALLALHRRPVRRAVIAGTLWPDKTESRASANLRSILWRMNGAGSPGVVVCCGSSLGLRPGLGVDVVTLEEAGWALLDGSISAAAGLGFERLSQELLPGWYEDWVIVERERLGQLQIRFLEALVDALRRAGKFARAIDYAMRLVATDPLRERSQLALIHALVDEGSWGRARWQADQYRELLRETFGPGAAAAFDAEHAALLPFDNAPPQQDPAQTGSARREPAHVGPGRWEPANVGSARQQPAQAGSARQEPAQVGSARQEPAHVGSGRREMAHR